MKTKERFVVYTDNLIAAVTPTDVPDMFNLLSLTYKNNRTRADLSLDELRILKESGANLENKVTSVLSPVEFRFGSYKLEQSS